MGVKKIVISPDNTKALEFFDDLDRRKEEARKKAEESPVVKMMMEKILRGAAK